MDFLVLTSYYFDMTIPTHIMLGAIIGKITGNYSLAIGASIVPDFDHLSSYIRSGVIKTPKVFWKTITDEQDPYGNQRGILHNLIVFVFVSIILILFLSKVGYVLVLGWLGHIILDALDRSDYWPFYPNKKVNIRGLIKYASIQEFIFFLVLLVVYCVI